MGDTPFRKRLQAALENKRWTLNQLRTVLGEGRGFYEKVNRPDPSFALVTRVAEVLGVATEWLGAGRGPMLAKRRTDVVRSEILWDAAVAEMPELHTIDGDTAKAYGPGLRIAHADAAVRSALDSYSFDRGFWKARVLEATSDEDWRRHGQDFGRAMVAPLRVLGISPNGLRQPIIDQYATAMALALEILISGDIQVLLEKIDTVAAGGIDAAIEENRKAARAANTLRPEIQDVGEVPPQASKKPKQARGPRHPRGPRNENRSEG